MDERVGVKGVAHVSFIRPHGGRYCTGKKVHVCVCSSARAWRLRDPTRCITHFDGDGLLTVERSLMPWFLRLFKGPTQVRWDVILAANTASIASGWLGSSCMLG